MVRQAGQPADTPTILHLFCVLPCLFTSPASFQNLAVHVAPAARSRASCGRTHKTRPAHHHTRPYDGAPFLPWQVKLHHAAEEGCGAPLQISSRLSLSAQRSPSLLWQEPEKRVLLGRPTNNVKAGKAAVSRGWPRESGRPSARVGPPWPWAAAMALGRRALGGRHEPVETRHDLWPHAQRSHR